MPAAKPAGVHILIAEDSRFDRLILEQVFAELGLDVILHFVGDGIELLDYLNARNPYAGPDAAPRPAVILLDANMPRMDGNDALKSMRADPKLRTMPVVMLSTSNSPSLVAQAYLNGVNGFMIKPGPFDEFVEMLRRFAAYWFGCMTLPPMPVAP